MTEITVDWGGMNRVLAIMQEALEKPNENYKLLISESAKRKVSFERRLLQIKHLVGDLKNLEIVFPKDSNRGMNLDTIQKGNESLNSGLNHGLKRYG